MTTSFFTPITFIQTIIFHYHYHSSFIQTTIYYIHHYLSFIQTIIILTLSTIHLYDLSSFFPYLSKSKRLPHLFIIPFPHPSVIPFIFTYSIFLSKRPFNISILSLSNSNGLLSFYPIIFQIQTTIIFLPHTTISIVHHFYFYYLIPNVYYFSSHLLSNVLQIN